ncbi:MAG: UPF0164 family protein [Thermoanaerobaculia bacterium]
MTKRAGGLTPSEGPREFTRAPRLWKFGSVLFMVILAGSGAGFPPGALANEPAQLIFTPHFSLANPGARSPGLGGAFTALADDATAALANPAGLDQLAEPEVSVEGRQRSATARRSRGRIVAQTRELSGAVFRPSRA